MTRGAGCVITSSHHDPPLDMAGIPCIPRYPGISAPSELIVSCGSIPGSETAQRVNAGPSLRQVPRPGKREEQTVATDGTTARRKSQKTPRDAMYSRWHNMIRRCTNSNDPGWRNYGGRGIKVCDEWLQSFDAYYATVGDPPFEGATLDRIDNDGNYEPGNVRWATRSQQSANRRPFARSTDKRTSCKNGHPWLPENWYIQQMPDGKGRRTCAICRDASRERSRARDRAARAAMPPSTDMPDAEFWRTSCLLAWQRALDLWDECERLKAQLGGGA